MIFPAHTGFVSETEKFIRFWWNQFWFMLSAFPLFIVLKDVLVKTSPSDVLEVANQMLATTLIKNFANMDHATKRNSVSVKHPNIPTN